MFFKFPGLEEEFRMSTLNSNHVRLNNLSLFKVITPRRWWSWHYVCETEQTYFAKAPTGMKHSTVEWKSTNESSTGDILH